MRKSKCFLTIAALVALLFVSGAIWAQQSPNTAEPAARPEANPNRSIQSQPQPTAQTRGTDEAPIAVKVISIPDAKTETPDERASRIAHEQNEKGLTDYTGTLAKATIGLIVVAALQAGLFLWQLVYMRAGLRDARIAAEAAQDSATTARNSVDIAKLSMIAGDRAYVHFIGCRWISHRESGACPVFWRIRPRWTNTGNTPTRGLELYAHYELLDHPLDANYQFVPAVHERRLATIAPKGLVESESRDFFGSDLAAVKDGTKYLYIWGTARYRDVFPRSSVHTTRFCVVATHVTGNPLEPWDEKTNPFDIVFATYDRHNCADEDCVDQA
jgi:hypothetical protein